MTFDNASD